MKAKLKTTTKRSLKQRREDEVLRLIRESKSHPARRVGRLQSPGPASIKARAAHVEPKTRQQRNAAARPAAKAGDPVRYDNNQRYDTPGLHYVTDDPPPTPTPGKAKVKLELQSRTDGDLIGFGHSHDEAIDLNPKFPTPEPTALAFEAALAAYESKVAEIENHRIAGKNLTADRDALRGTFEYLFNLRGEYVQITSQGDGNWIASAGLPVRNAPTPVGILATPQNLRVDLTNDEGVMIVRWDSVTGAKSYMLEYAEVVNNVAVNWTLLYMGGKFSTRRTGMTVGKTYAFRVAAVGGEGGKSEFSPEVWRAAA